MALQGQNGSAIKEDVEKDVELQQRVPTAPMRESGQDLVEFDGPDDPENPKNWSKARKWKITAAMGGMTFVVTFASSVFVSTIASSSQRDND
jgi:hypothetical protein